MTENEIEAFDRLFKWSAPKGRSWSLIESDGLDGQTWELSLFIRGSSICVGDYDKEKDDLFDLYEVINKAIDMADRGEWNKNG